MKKLFVFLITLIISTLVIELFLNFSLITPPTLKYYDNEFGSLNRHNIKYLKSVEGLYVGHTNYDGRFRENYPQRKSDKKTLRIMLLGDSFVEGIDVFSKNHFAQYIEDGLSKKLNRKVEVIDCGRGNSTIHMMSYYFINYLSKQYDADLVLIFTEGRDIFDMSNDHSSPSTTYKLDSAHNLVRSDDWKTSPDYLLDKKLSGIPVVKYYDRSSYFRLLYRAIARVKLQGFAGMTFGKFVHAPYKELTYGNSQFDDPVSVLTRKLYDTLYKYDKGQVIYVLRNKPIYTPAIVEYMKYKKYAYIDLADTFSNFYIKNTKIDAYYFKATHTYGGHWNNEGHEAVGNFLSNKIYSNLNSYNMPGYEK